MLMSTDHGELRILSHILSDRVKYGTFDGHIYVEGVSRSESSAPVALVSRVSFEFCNAFSIPLPYNVVLYCRLQRIFIFLA